MIKCKYCSTHNALDRVLCISCGKELDFNDPTLFELENEQSQQNKTVNPQEIKVKLATDNLLENSTTFLILAFILLSIFFSLYNGHIIYKPLNFKIAKSLEKKLSHLENYDKFEYIALSDVESNFYIEKKLIPISGEIPKTLPRFLNFQKSFISLNNYDLNLHLLFKILKRNIIITFTGVIKIEEQKLFLNINKTYIGKHIVPKILVFKLLKKFVKLIKTKNLLVVNSNISSIKIEKQKIILHLKTEGAKEKITHKKEKNIPFDILLVQAADSFYSRKKYNLSLKYYNLAIFHVPSSPLKPYIKNQVEKINKLLNPEI